MPNAVRCGAVLVLASCGAASWADPYGFNESAPNKNVIYSAQVSVGAPFGPATGPGLKVSGTDVNVTFSGGARSVAYTGSDPWAGAEVIKIHAKIADASTKVWNVQNGWGGGLPPDAFDGESRAARFASTHVADGGAIALWCKAEVDLIAQDDSRTRVQIEVTITVNAYNKHLSWANAVGTAAIGGVPSQEDMFIAQFTAATTRLAQPNLRHSSLNTEPIVAKDDIVDLLDDATVVFATTHGSTAGLGSSLWGPGNEISSQFLSWAEIETNVTNGGFREVPPPNMVFMYSCDALAASPTSTFMMVPPIRDKAIAGFTAKVHACLVPGNGQDYVSWEEMFGPIFLTDPQPAGYLSQHVASLFDTLKALHAINSRIEGALGVSNAAYPPRGEPTSEGFPRLNMTFVGDPAASLSRVYLSTEEDAAFFLVQIFYKQWYIYF